MKFSKFLQTQQSVPIFRGQWVTYRSLKKLIKKIVKTESSNNVDPEVYASQLWWYDSSQRNSLGSIPKERIQFITLVETEINKTAQFYTSRRKDIVSMLSEIQQRIEGRFALDLLIKDIDEIAAELLLLERFIHQAKQLLLKITKKNDKQTNYKVSTWMLIRLEKEEFWNPKISDLVIAVSDAYTIARLLQENYTASSSDEDENNKMNTNNNNNKNKEEKQNGKKVAAQDFVRKNDKYFIRPEDVLLVKMIIVKHLPLDIFGRQKNALKKDGSYSADHLNLEDTADLQDSTVINSIYLDNNEKTMYHERTGIETKKGNLIRVRWYGSHPNPPQDCFMERKTRQTVTDSEMFLIDEAVKERFMLKQSNVKNYMTGEWNAEKKVEGMRKKNQIGKKEAAELLNKANLIQNEIVSKTLRPMLRTVVRRSAFQWGTDQSLRLSLDTNLHVINEDVSKESGWARDLSQPIRLSEVKTLPYGILEIKTQTTPPQWITDLIQSGLLLRASNFSKFQYGSCKLSSSSIRFTPSWWSTVTQLESQPPAVVPLSLFCPVSPLSKRLNRSHDTTSISSPSSLLSPPKSQSPFPSAANLNPTPVPSISVSLPPSFPPTSEIKSNPLRYPPPPSPSSPPPVLSGSPPLPQFASPPPPPSPQVLSDPIPHNKKSPFHTSINNDEIVTHDYKFGNDGYPEKEGWAFQWHNVRATVTSFFGLDTVSKYAILGKGENKKRTSQQRVAKAFFANERTLLSWLNTASFLSLTGLTLLTTESKATRVSGFLLSMCTVLFAAYALYKYWKRLSGLSNPNETNHLGDKRGPVLLIIAFCFALFLSSIYFLVDD